MKRLWVLCVVAGCSPGMGPAAPENHPLVSVYDGGAVGLHVLRFTDTLPDGGVVYCYVSKAGYSGGIACMRRMP